MRPVICDVLGVASDFASRGGGGPTHRHQEVELTLVVQGMVTYLFGGQVFALQAGQLAVFWAAIPHRVLMMEEGATLYWLTIPLGYLLRWRLPGSLTQQVMDGAFVVDRLRASAHFDQYVFQRWNNDLTQSASALRAIVLLESEACLRRLDWSLRNSKPDIPQSDTTLFESQVAIASRSDWQRAKQAAQFLTAHYQQTLHVDDLAKELGLHPHSVMRLFQKTFGVSMVEYLTPYRLAHAQRLLATTDLSVVEIATTSGFGSLSHFYSVFTRDCGRSPQAYRQSLSSQEP